MLYTGNATFSSSGGQDVQIAYSGDNLFSGDIAINSNKVVFNTASGKVTFTGGNSQTLNGSYNYPFKKLAINKSANHVIANTTLSVDDTLFFISKNLITTSSNLLTLKSGSTVSGTSNNSFVSGPVKKVGATTFVFPVGKSEQYRAASITAPSNAIDAFTCEYFDTSQTVGMYRDTSIKFLSDCNYWTILRTTGTSNVNVKLGYCTTYCSMLDSAHLVVVNWNDTLWKNLGNGGITGNKNQGLVANSSTVIKYGKFTLGYSSCQLRAFSGADATICHRDSVLLGGSPTALHGSSPFTHSWKHSVFLSDTTSANPFVNPDSTTQFSLLVTDSIGCTSRDTAIITVQPILEVILSNVKPLCYGDNNGQVRALVTGGIEPYTYFWLPDSSSNDSLFNLEAGSYSLLVTDSNTCTQRRTFNLEQPRKLQTWKSIKPISCHGLTDGSISIHTLGGIKPYQFEWIGRTDTLAFLDQLPADTFYLVITDVNNCTYLDTILITEPSSISMDLDLLLGDTIFEGIPFQAQATDGAFVNYQFFNNDSLIRSQSTPILNSNIFIDGDTLKVVATDSAGCSWSAMKVVNVIPLDTVMLVSNLKKYCPGRENPFVIGVDDPDTTLSYLWYKNEVLIDSITGPEFNETSPPNISTIYTVKASDNSVYGKFHLTVSEIEISKVYLAPNCFGEEVGEIGVSARGGSGVYEYNLNSASYSSAFEWENLPTGTHTVEVRDDTGCVASKNIVIPEVSIATSIEE